jgi:XRE family transcriptional regulator, regulator of sulfur utilization
MEIGTHLARCLKELRREKGWSLDSAAQATGVSKAMLGQIERGESSPTVATLWKIATGFSTSFSGLLATPAARLDRAVIVRGGVLSPTMGDGGLQIRTLFAFEPRFGFELFELTLPPGTEHLSEAHEDGVIEHVMVVDGDMELLLDGRWQSLATGDAARFAADAPHGYRNKGGNSAVFHNLIHYPPGASV